MIAVQERVFVDTGAWVALAVVRDALHERAREAYESLLNVGARLFTSSAVLLETFTYLDRKGSRDLALRWHAALARIPRFGVLDVTTGDFALGAIDAHV